MNRASGADAHPQIAGPTRDYAGWVMRAAVAVAFTLVGYGKFDSSPHSEWVQLFARIGLGQWFRYVTGIVEIAGGVLYLSRRTCFVGAALLCCAMIGATIALCTVLGSPVASVVPLALLVAVVLIALRIPETRLVQNRWRVPSPTMRPR